MLMEMLGELVRRCRLIALSGVVMMFCAQMHAQHLIGTQGLMNIPSAEMNPSGTFEGGISLLQEQMMADKYDYYTGLYYISFTPFSFVELTFRETLRKTKKSK